MTLRMGDGPVANLPPGLDAYAGYVDDSGIGVTWPEVMTLPAAHRLSISVHGVNAMCGDVEKGALNSWKGYTVGYCSISKAADLIARDGRPRKLWVAHYDPTRGSHICTSSCWPGLPAGFRADGTQWTDHGGAWDESLLADDFFDFLAPPPSVPIKEETMQSVYDPSGRLVIVGEAADNGNLLVVTQTGAGWSVADVTDEIHAANPGDPRTYRLH